MEISTGDRSPIGEPSTTESDRCTVPKSASGRMPPLLVQHGASMMTSAEDRSAPDTVCVVLVLQPRVTSASVSLNWLLPS